MLNTLALGIYAALLSLLGPRGSLLRVDTRGGLLRVDADSGGLGLLDGLDLDSVLDINDAALRAGDRAANGDEVQLRIDLDNVEVCLTYFR